MILSTSIRSWFLRPLRWVKTIFSLKSGLIFLLVVLFSTFVAVMVCKNVEAWVGHLLGLSNKKNEILTFLGIGMGGILLALQAVIANRRARAMEDAANAQAKATEEQAKANENTERGQRQERLKNAIEHLGHDSDSVRLGGAYELFHLAKDNKDLCQTVMDILCAHIRRTTGEAEYREKHPSKPSEEVQSLLTLLFVQEYTVFKGCHVNLQGSWLNGADLREAHLEHAVMVGAYLQRTELENSHLRNVDLTEACLTLANLTAADLREAIFHKARLLDALLNRARLQSTKFFWAQMQGVKLIEAQMQGAVLDEVDLQGADLSRAQLQLATLSGVKLQAAGLGGTQLQGATLDCVYLGGVRFGGVLSAVARIQNRSGQPANLVETIFQGGLSEQDLNSILEDVSHEEPSVLRERLKSHIDKPKSYELPEDSSVDVDAYTPAEAERWIAEYDEAMAEVPKVNNG